MASDRKAFVRNRSSLQQDKISSEILFGGVENVPYSPARLSSDAWNKARQKFFTQSDPCVDWSVLCDAATYVLNSYRTTYGFSSAADSDSVKSALDPSKSAGLAFEEFRQKRDIMANPELYAIVEHYAWEILEQASLPLSKAMLKDELRDNARVLQNKTRLFVAVDFAMVVAGMTLFLDQNQHFYHGDLNESIVVGMNPYHDWQIIYNKFVMLESQGNTTYAHDFSGFDSKFSRVLYAAIAFVRSGLFKSDQREDVSSMVYNYYLALSNSWLYLPQDNTFAQVSGQEQSGNPNTISDNCIAQDIMFAYYYLLKTGDSRFRNFKLNQMSHCGDDGLSSFGPWFDPVGCTKMFREHFGMDIEFEPNVGIDNVTFCSARFEYSTVVHRICPKYDQTKILSSACWFRKDELSSRLRGLMILAYPWKETYEKLIEIWAAHKLGNLPFSDMDLYALYTHYEKQNLSLEQNLDDESLIMSSRAPKSWLTTPEQIEPVVRKLLDQVLDPDSIQGDILIPPMVQSKSLVSVKNHQRFPVAFGLPLLPDGTVDTASPAGECMVVSNPCAYTALCMTAGQSVVKTTSSLQCELQWTSRGNVGAEPVVAPTNPLQFEQSGVSHFLFPIAQQQIAGSGYSATAPMYPVQIGGDATAIPTVTVLFSEMTCASLANYPGWTLKIGMRNASTKVWQISNFTTGSGCPSPFSSTTQTWNGTAGVTYDQFTMWVDCVTPNNVSMQVYVIFQCSAFVSYTITVPNISRHLIDYPYSIMNNGTFCDKALIAHSVWIQNTSSELYNGGNTGAVSTNNGFSAGNFGGISLAESIAQVPGAIEGKVKDGLYSFLTPTLRDAQLSPFYAHHWDNSNNHVVNVPDRVNASMQVIACLVLACTTYDQNFHFQYPAQFHGYDILLERLNAVSRVMENARHLEIINKALNDVKKVVNSKEVSELVAKTAGVAKKGAKLVPVVGPAASAGLSAVEAGAKANSKRIDKKTSGAAGRQKPKKKPQKPKSSSA